MQTIIITSTHKLWEIAQKLGEYVQSTTDKKLDDVGFIHATYPDQTIAMLNKHFIDRNDILLLLVDLDKVTSEVKHEAPISGRAGMFPHIYGPLNLDAVYGTITPDKDNSDKFVELAELHKQSL